VILPESSERVCVSEGGRIVIPARFRKALGLSPGDDVVVRLDGDELRIVSVGAGIARAQAIMRKHSGGRPLVDEFIAERRV
jgi:AbrB family looped-hinge helix DNA binding protein